MRDSFEHALLGFRLWTTDGDGTLQSLVIGWDWQPGINRASCAKGWYERKPKWQLPHRVPAKRCQCGFHAYHRLEGVREHAAGLHRNLHLDCVVGAVAGWGNLQVHPDGFRSEYCQILALSARSLDAAPGLFASAERYGVEVLSLPELANPDSYQGVLPAPQTPGSGPSIRREI